MSDWISVEERLPYNNQEVIALIESAFIQTVCVFKVYEDDIYFESQETGDNINTKYEDMVTHWMPLPEPPKE